MKKDLYRVKEDVQKYDLKKGFYIMLDKKYGDYLELFDGRGVFQKAINLDSTLNKEKTDISKIIEL